MADLSSTIQIIISAVDDTGAAFRSVTDGVGRFAGSIEDATQPMADMAKGILAIDAAIAGIAIAFGVTAVNAANEFEDSLQLVDKQLSDTGPTLQQAREDIEALALQYGANANAVAGSAAGFLAAGYDYKTAASLIDTSTQFMIASELEATVSTKALVSSLAGFRIPAEDAAEGAVKVGDILNKIGDISSGSFADIVQGFVDIASTAKDSGLSLEETAAAIATIVDTGRGGAEAATALKSGLLSLLAPAADAAGKLKELDVSLVDSNGELRAAWDIMGDVAEATSGMTDSQKLQTAAIIFGKDQAGAMNALMSDWGKTQNYVTQMLDETTGAVGSMAREVDGKLALMSTSIDRSKEAWRQFQTAFGEEIKAGGQLQSLVDSLGKLGTALKDAVNAGQLDPLFQPWKDAFAGLEAVVANVARNLPQALAQIDWSEFNDSIDGLGDAFEGMFDGIDISTPEGLAEAIQLVVDAGEGLIRTTTGIFEGMEPLFLLIGGAVKTFSELSPEVQAAAGYLLGLSVTVNTVAGVVGGLALALGGAATGLIALLKVGVVGAAGAAGYAVGTVFADALNKTLSILSGSDTSLGSEIYDLVQDFKDLELGNESAAGALLKPLNPMLQLGAAAFKLGTDIGEAAFGLGDVGDKGYDAEAGAKVAEAALGLLGTAANDAGLDTDALVAEFNALMPALIGTGVEADKAAQAQYRYRDGTLQMLDATGRWIETSWDAFEVSGESADALDEQTAAVQRQADEQRILNEASTEYLLGWQRILSEERVAIFELAADIRVAEIEADAQRTVAAFDSMARSFESTGEVLTELFSIWSGMDTIGDKSKVEDWINREYAIREKLAEGQLSLVEAEVRRIAAQTALLERGGVAVNISADGLDPALEAFMFAVLDKVRVQIAGDYTDFLLGCGS